MADTEHSKCFARKGVRVRIPLPALTTVRQRSEIAHVPDGRGEVIVAVVPPLTTVMLH